MNALLEIVSDAAALFWARLVTAPPPVPPCGPRLPVKVLRLIASAPLSL